MKVFRIIARSLRDSLKSISRNFSLSMASILCATITLLIVGVSIVVAANVNSATKSLEDELSIIVYLEKNTTDEDLNFLKDQIQKMNNVDKVDTKSKDVWLDEMTTYSSSFENIFKYLEENPLLNTLVVTVKDVNELDKITNDIRDLDNVNEANYGEDTVKPLLTAFDLIKKVTFVMVVSLILVTAFLISNTIKLTIYSRRDNIEIMRLVGASNAAIRLPFVFEGFFLGIIGSIIPIIVIVYGYLILFEQLGGQLYTELIPLIAAKDLLVIVSLILVAIGAVVGMFGSLRAVRKYLKI